MDPREYKAREWLGIPNRNPAGFELTQGVIDAINDPNPNMSDWPEEVLETFATLSDNDRVQVQTFAAFLGAVGRA